MGRDTQEKKPKVFSVARRMQPSSPHLAPTVLNQPVFASDSCQQHSMVQTTTAVRQNSVLQGDQIEASTATEIGLPVSTLDSESQPEKVINPAILTFPPSIVHFRSLAVQGYFSLVLTPLSLTYLNAETMQPPLQPRFPQDHEHSLSCFPFDNRFGCSLIRERFRLRQMLRTPNISHKRLVFYLVYLFLETQSTSITIGVIWFQAILTIFQEAKRVRQRTLNSASVRSVNCLTQQLCFELALLALCSAILTKFLRKMVLLYYSSPDFPQFFWQSALYCSKEQGCQVFWQPKRAQAATAVRRTATKYCLLIRIFIYLQCNGRQ